MSQVKIDDEVKREIALYAAFMGRNLKEVLETSWQEFKVNHREEFRRGLAWAESIFDDAGAAAVAASGMSAADVEEINQAFNGEAASTALGAPQIAVSS